MQKDFEIWWAEQAAFNQVWIETTLRSICRQTILQYLFLIGPHAKQSRTVLDSGFHAVDSRFQVLDSWFSYQWNLDSRLQSLVGFRIPLAEYRIPKPSIPDSAGKNFPDSRLHKPKIPRLRNLDYFTYKGESVFAHIYSPNLRNERPSYRTKNQRLVFGEQ